MHVGAWRSFFRIAFVSYAANGYVRVCEFFVTQASFVLQYITAVLVPVVAFHADFRMRWTCFGVWTLGVRRLLGQCHS